MADEGRIEEIQDEASKIGHRLLQLAYYRLDDVSEGLAEDLRPMARALHLLETERLYMDGGISMNKILMTLHDLGSDLQTLLANHGIQ